MIDDESAPADFGCEHCWPTTPDAAWEASQALDRAADLIDESHFHVMIVACPSCTQRFVFVFTETIDWVDGEDPQYWTLLPITAAEAAELVRQPGPTTEAQLDALGPNRRCLRHDHPKGAESRSYWSTGSSVGWHD